MYHCIIIIIIFLLKTVLLKLCSLRISFLKKIFRAFCSIFNITEFIWILLLVSSESKRRTKYWKLLRLKENLKIRSLVSDLLVWISNYQRSTPIMKCQFQQFTQSAIFIAFFFFSDHIGLCGFNGLTEAYRSFLRMRL